MKIEPTNLLKALKEKPSHEVAKDVSDEEKVEVANELHEWLNDPSVGRGRLLTV